MNSEQFAKLAKYVADSMIIEDSKEWNSHIDKVYVLFPDVNKDLLDTTIDQLVDIWDKLSSFDENEVVPDAAST